jgi:hypothetical protein
MSSRKHVTFAEKVSELQNQIDLETKKISSSERCFPTMLIAGIVTPFLLLLILFFLQPSFVQRKEGEKYVRDGRRIFYWTLGVTLVVWLAMYLYTFCDGFSSMSMLCSK